MRIHKILNQNRRDFTAIYSCHCGHIQRGTGYDDTNFHNNVIPTIKCELCGQTSRDSKEEYRPLAPKYAEGVQV